MRVTFFSALMAVLFSDALILMAYALRRRLWFVRAFGTHSLIALYLGCALRLLFGFELEVAVEIPVPLFNPMAALLGKTIPLGPEGVPLGILLMAVWLIVALAAFVWTVRKYRCVWRMCRSLPGAGGEVVRLLQEIVTSRDAGKIRVAVSSRIGSPCLSGIFKGTICLPEREWKQGELFCVLRHEYAHFQHHDELTYLLADLFCALFWFNPGVYLLKRCVKEILEYKADEAAARGLKPSEVRFYCKTLIEFAGARAATVPDFTASKLECRVARLMDRPISRGSKVLSKAALFLIAAALFLVSYGFVFQSYFTADIGMRFALEDRFSEETHSEHELDKLRELSPVE